MASIDRLRYLAENTAEPGDRKALNDAISLMVSHDWDEKLYAVKKQLDELSPTDPEFLSKLDEITKSLVYPEHEYIPTDLEEILKKIGTIESEDEDTVTLKVSKKILKNPIQVCEDDGMGYCTHTAFAFDCDLQSNKILRIWV